MFQHRIFYNVMHLRSGQSVAGGVAIHETGTEHMLVREFEALTAGILERQGASASTHTIFVVSHIVLRHS